MAVRILKRRENAVSDEQVVAALVTNPTIKDAAAAVGLSTRAVYDRMQSREFNRLYIDAKVDILRSATNAVNFRLIQAVETIADVMNDQGNNAAVRMQAAQFLINGAVKMSAAVRDAEVNASTHDEKLQLLQDQIDAEVERRARGVIQEWTHLLLQVLPRSKVNEVIKMVHNMKVERQRRQNSGE